MPLLTEKAYKDDSAPSASDPTTGQDDEAGGAGGVEDEISKKDKGGKKAKGEGKKKGGGGKNKKDKEKGQDKEDGSGQGQGQDEEGEVMVIDEIWPKKEALGLTKW
jgi:PUA domain protein